MRTLLVALGLTAAGMMAPAARAYIVVAALPVPQGIFNDFPNVNLYPIDLNSDGVPDYTFGASAGSVSLRTEGANRVVIRESPPPNIGGPVAKLDADFPIGAHLDVTPLAWINSDPREGYVSPGEMAFATIVICLSTGCGSTWPPGPAQRGFIGLEFELDDGLHYGYFDISLSGSAPGAALYGWAYETRPGVPIKAGAKPVVVPTAAPEVARPGYLRLRWSSEVGKGYQVQAKTRLETLRWTDLDFVIPATSTETMIDLPMEGAAQFFRVIEAD